jgi:hypothetical protein
VNTLVILRVIPSMGGDIAFLADTPHARVPLLIMMPWFITAIAVLVEVNFRGFLLGLPRWNPNSGVPRASAVLLRWLS